MRKSVLVVLLLAIFMIVPVVVNGAMIGEMKPIEKVVPEGGEVTLLPSSTVLPPGATVTSELTSETTAVYEGIPEATATDEEFPETAVTDEEFPETEALEADNAYDWVPDVVSEYAREYGTIVVVDIASQHVYMCVDGAVIADADCVSGDMYNSPTPTGLYSIWYKVRGLYMMGAYYTEYAAFFNGDIALHDADAWRSEYGGYIYQGGGSHGCVNMPRWFAEIVYNNTWEGTPVYVF